MLLDEIVEVVEDLALPFREGKSHRTSLARLHYTRKKSEIQPAFALTGYGEASPSPLRATARQALPPYGLRRGKPFALTGYGEASPSPSPGTARGRPFALARYGEAGASAVRPELTHRTCRRSKLSRVSVPHGR